VGEVQQQSGSPTSAAIAELSLLLDRSTSAQEIIAALGSRLPALIPHDGFAVYLRSGDFLLPQFIDGDVAKAFSMHQVPLGEGLSGWVAEHARPIVNGNPTVESNYIPDSGLLSEASSALSVPFFDANGSVFGVITLYSMAGAAFSKDHLRILEALESRFTRALQKALSSTIELKDARTDPAVASLAAL
jgi:putative methionine-R-sulfoxide reductase with GAF domain